MDVERRPSGRLDQKGQSMIEFLFMVPMMVAIAAILIRVNMAMQVSIVNQQYARSQALYLTYNNPVYPGLNFREGKAFKDSGGDQNLVDQMVIGVSDNLAEEGTIEPVATTQKIVRTGKNIGNDDPQKEDASERGNIRIRNTVALCTQYNSPVTDQGFSGFCRGIY